jgi:hypothetical protein
VPIPTWSVGQVLAASDVNNWFVPLAAYRTSTQSVTSSTTLVNDNALFVTVAANAVYRGELVLIYDGDTAGDLKAAWTVPASATISTAFATGLSGSAAAATDDLVTGASNTPQFGALGSGTNCAALYIFILTTSGTSGTLQFQWAQNTSSATATRVFAGSHLVLQRIA